jgi:hypothetical protein
MLKEYVRGWNVHENKQKDDMLPEEKGDISAPFTLKRASFAETVGFFVTFRTLGNEFLASKCRNSSADL